MEEQNIYIIIIDRTRNAYHIYSFLQLVTLFFFCVKSDKSV